MNRDHDGLYLIDILSGIRSMRDLSDKDVLDIVNALHGRFAQHEDEGVPAALCECSRAIECEIERTAVQDNARDWHREQERARESAALFAAYPSPF